MPPATCVFHDRLQEQTDAQDKRLSDGDCLLARLDERLKIMERLVYWATATTVGAVIVTMINLVLSLRNGGAR